MNNLLNPQKYRQVNPFNMFNLWFFIYIRNFSKLKSSVSSIHSYIFLLIA